MKNLMQLFYSAAETTLTDVVEVNSSFATGKLKIMYTDENRNGSNIPEEAVKDAIPSIFNIPIVAHYSLEDNEIGGHDMQVVKTDDGGLRLRNLTEPCGVITDHTKIYMERSADENGVEHNYLVADGVVLWKRQDAVQHIIGDLGGHIKHSMEIEVLDGAANKDTGYFDIKKFEFQALCLLGNCEPCFEGSELNLFSASDFKEKMEQMMDELKCSFTAIFGANDTTQKGEQSMDEEMKKNGNQDTDTAATAVEPAAENEPADGVSLFSTEAANDNSADTSENSNDGNTTGGNDDSTSDSTPESFELVSNVENLLEQALAAETFTAPWGSEIQKYHLADFDAEKHEAYCYDRMDWTLWALGYEFSGDAVKVNFDSRRRVKIAYVDFVGDEAGATTASFCRKDNVYEQAAAFAKEKDDLTAKLDAANAELETLRAFKADAEKTASESARKAVIDKFSQKFAAITDSDEYTTLVEAADQYTAEQLEEKFYAIVGKMNLAFSANPQRKFAIEDFGDSADTSNKPYGGIVERYTKH